MLDEQACGLDMVLEDMRKRGRGRVVVFVWGRRGGGTEHTDCQVRLVNCRVVPKASVRQHCSLRRIQTGCPHPSKMKSNDHHQTLAGNTLHSPSRPCVRYSHRQGVSTTLNTQSQPQTLKLQQRLHSPSRPCSSYAHSQGVSTTQT